MMTGGVFENILCKCLIFLFYSNLNLTRNGLYAYTRANMIII
jgi:hypothetical protein